MTTSSAVAASLQRQQQMQSATRFVALFELRNRQQNQQFQVPAVPRTTSTTTVFEACNHLLAPAAGDLTSLGLLSIEAQMREKAAALRAAQTSLQQELLAVEKLKQLHQDELQRQLLLHQLQQELQPQQQPQQQFGMFRANHVAAAAPSERAGIWRNVSITSPGRNPTERSRAMLKDSPSTAGLDLLRSSSVMSLASGSSTTSCMSEDMITPVHASPLRAGTNNLGALAHAIQSPLVHVEARNGTTATTTPPNSRSPVNVSEGLVYTDQVRENDVLCGRGGRSNHHSGNKRYRTVISEMRRKYRHTEDKAAKTDLSRAIVDHVISYGGRFIKHEKDGKYLLLSRDEARKKTSQALRETKIIKWTH